MTAAGQECQDQVQHYVNWGCVCVRVWGAAMCGVCVGELIRSSHVLVCVFPVCMCVCVGWCVCGMVCVYTCADGHVCRQTVQNTMTKLTCRLAYLQA